MTHVTAEIESQPQVWRQAIKQGRAGHPALPQPGERVAVVGCGTSWFMAQSYAVSREESGQGVTDAFSASEMQRLADYDRVMAITRSGTTTEVLDLLASLPQGLPTVALTADPNTPIVKAAGEVIVLDFADERSVVQTRFATSALVFLLTHLGQDLDAAVADAERALAEPVAPELVKAEQFTFLGRGWTVGLAHEAALKMREAAGAWTESYPAMEYRHGPISITGPGRVTWMFGSAPEGLAEDVRRTGGSFVTSELNPLADLVRAQRLAVALAEARGVDPDNPRHLTRSVILEVS